MDILVVAAHPDDETLGCGGTLAAHAQAGDAVTVLFLADGETARDPSASSEQRYDAARQASVVLGLKEPRFRGLPDNRLDTIPLLDVVMSIEEVLREIRPEIVYTHHGGDLNIDHHVAHRATLTACRPLPGSSVRSVFTFETVSSTEWSPVDQGQAFQPRYFVDVSDTYEAKHTALRCYESEMRPTPHARSLQKTKALAELRGAQCGVPLAEAFGLIRAIGLPA